jgi:hypothetical protein
MPAKSVNRHLYRVDKYVVPASLRDEIVSRLSKRLLSVLGKPEGLSPWARSVALEGITVLWKILPSFEKASAQPG